MTTGDPTAGIVGICDVEVVHPPGGDPSASPAILFEVPHGATTRADFDAVRSRLIGDRFPEDLEAFFFVNTDVGAPETARAAARLATDPDGRSVLARMLGEDDLADARRFPPRPVAIVRGRVPRTFVDCNRAIDGNESDRMTPGIPPYVTADEDIAWLGDAHRSYRAVAEPWYERVCASGGIAVTLHTYAPRSVGIDRVDENIVAALRDAYRDDVYETWPRRPAVDLITRDDDDRYLAPRGLVDALRDRYRRVGLEPGENETYRLHAGTEAHRHASRWPGQVLCMEIDRSLLADPFDPFREMRIAPDKVARMAAPIAGALLQAGFAVER